MEIVLIILYTIPTVVLFIYSCIQLNLVWNYWTKKSKYATAPPIATFKPFVTIQLPIYNERYVVARLIDTVCAIDYPKNKLEIQVLDDSTDETSVIIAKKVVDYQGKGIQISHIRRPSREGYKAGALAYGLSISKGDLIAIFDADFLPNPDFLQKTIPYFQYPEVGVVQTRWGHLNENYSLLTQLQAFGLNGHFVVEQGGRHVAAHYINFNGTAGVWRKTCIEDAGGWSADTLTEDLDLSYRAQVRGWQFVYLPQVETPAELPVTMPALKSQQYRWMKGGAECAVKNTKRLLNSASASISTKIHGTAHLLNSGVFIAVLLMAIVSVPTLFILQFKPQYNYLLYIFRWFQISIFMLILFYWTAHHARKSLIEILLKLPIFLIVIMGLSLHNSIAVIEGYIGKKTAFIRTPKWGIVQNNDVWRNKRYLLRSVNTLTMLEIFLTFYFLMGVVLGIYWHNYQMLLLHSMLTLGYGIVSYYSLKHSL